MESKNEVEVEVKGRGGDAGKKVKTWKKNDHFFGKLIAALAVLGGLDEGISTREEGISEELVSPGEGGDGKLALARYLLGGMEPKTGGNGGDFGGRVGDAQTRARENGQKVVVSEVLPTDPRYAQTRMTPKEVREMIGENCSLIKTVDKDLIPGIERRIKRLYEKGNTTRETLERYLERTCGLEDWQAKRIIDDQMNKYDARSKLELMKRAGVKLVKWCAGECEHHRPSHIANWPRGLNGCIFPIDEPPVDPATGERIYPGDLINCHCYLEAVD